MLSLGRPPTAKPYIFGRIVFSVPWLLTRARLREHAKRDKPRDERFGLVLLGDGYFFIGAFDILSHASSADAPPPASASH